MNSVAFKFPFRFYCTFVTKLKESDLEGVI